MSAGTTLSLVSFVAASSLLTLIALLFSGRNRRLDGRLQDLVGQAPAPTPPLAVAQITRNVLPKIGVPLIPTTEKENSRLATRLIHAGFYSRHAMVVFLGVKMLLIVVPTVAGMIAAVSGVVPLLYAALYGLLGSGTCMLAPSIWLDARKKKRQAVLRRSLPD